MRPTIESALFDYATIELHNALSGLVETSKGPLIVRRLAEHRNAVLVDVNGRNSKHQRPIDRFWIEYAKETTGNRRVDGVNGTERRRPSTLTAYAGSLNAWQLLVTFENCDPLEVYEWMMRVVVLDAATQ